MPSTAGAVIPTVLLLLVVIGGLSFLPLHRLINAWLVDKVLDNWLGLSAVLGHVTMVALMFYRPLSVVVLIYLVLLNIFVLLLPLIERLYNRKCIEKMREEDIAKFLRRIAQDPRNAAAHSALGDAYFQSRRYDEAIAEYQQAIDLDPEHSDGERYKQRHCTRVRDGLERPSSFQLPGAMLGRRK